MAVELKKLTAQDYELQKPGWCPGCGDFAIFASLKQILAKRKVSPHQVVTVAGIGCSGKIGDYMATYAIHTVHGRVLPVATAIKLVNPELLVIGAGGDGDAFAIGMGHFIHTARRNPDIVYIVMDNQIYGLTKGQFSPTSSKGFFSSSSPYGTDEESIDGVSLAVEAGASFVARGFSGDTKGLAEIFERAIEHKGFSFVDVLSPCVTFNRINTYKWFKERVFPVRDDKEYNPTNKGKVLDKLHNYYEQSKFPLGILYKQERDSLEKQLLSEDKPPIAFDDIKLSEKDFNSLLRLFK